MNKMMRVGAGAVAAAAFVAGSAISAQAGTDSYSASYAWGGYYRMSVGFDAANNETAKAMDTREDGYGAYVSWWSSGKSGTCNDTNGGVTLAWVSCGPLYLTEGAAFEARMCSKDYNNGVLVDSHCDTRFTLGYA